MKKINSSNINKIFNRINSNEYKIEIIKEIIKSIQNNTKNFSIHLFDDIYIETEIDDYREIIKKYYSILIDMEEYEICHQLQKINLQPDLE